jgi:ssDNA-binding Zn-finger/Zn-ribbon topoisomerase 1
MMWQGACPRCRGDLVLESDLFGEFVSCLQCGTILNESQEGSLRLLDISAPLCGGPRRTIRHAGGTAARRAA